MPAHQDKQKTPIWQIITSIFIGVISVTSIVALSVKIPNPTQWQAFVFRGCLALGLSAIAVIIPGFLSVNARIKGLGNYLKIMAGGAIAIFIVIWLANPPTIERNDQDPSTAKRVENGAALSTNTNGG